MSKVFLERLRPLYSSKVMKAIRVHQFGGPEVLKYDSEVPIPKPGKNDVLVRVKSVGINPVETYMRSGAYARKLDLPFTPGGDCAGIVEEVGSQVKSLKKGDRVFTWGTLTGSYAEFTVAASARVQPLNNALSFPQGASLGVPYLTAYRALYHKAGVRPGEVVLVHGASGGVGVAAVQFARASALTVVGTAGTPEGIELVKKAGAHFTFNHRQPDYIEQMQKALNGRPIDVIIENASHINLGKDLEILNERGRVVIIGSRGPIEVNPRDVMTRETTITGFILFNAPENEVAESFAAVQGGMEVGWLRPIVGKEFSLEKACDAHEDIINGSGALGKTVCNVE